jgi:hypothetical protein
MTKLWIGSLYYFLNVVLHMGVLGVLFFVSAPDQLTRLEYISEFWFSPEGRMLIILNSSLLIANLVFALSIIYVASRSSRVLIIMTFIAWMGLILAYLYGAVGLVGYAAGAIHLSGFSFNKFKTK